MLPSEELREWYEERAAIKEHHGGMSKKQAEEEAWDELLEKMRRQDGNTTQDGVEEWERGAQRAGPSGD